jgi:fructosamine-3-kinase
MALFQLYPLLVHAVLFGSPYLERAESLARSYL